MNEQVILITGASGTIGTAIAESLSEHKLALQYNNNHPKILTDNSITIKCDLRDETQIENMFNEIEQKLGKIDVVINNCGISNFSLLQDLSLNDWNDMINVNLTSAFLCSKRAIPNMVKKNSGTIINVSSIWGEVGASCEVHYSTAKGGLIAFTKALAKELAPSSILVNCVSPGLIESKMNEHLNEDELKEFTDSIALGRAGKAQEVASLIKFLVEENTYMTGQNLSINGLPL